MICKASHKRRGGSCSSQQRGTRGNYKKGKIWIYSSCPRAVFSGSSVRWAFAVIYFLLLLTFTAQRRVTHRLGLPSCPPHTSSWCALDIVCLRTWHLSNNMSVGKMAKTNTCFDCLLIVRRCRCFSASVCAPKVSQVQLQKQEPTVRSADTQLNIVQLLELAGDSHMNYDFCLRCLVLLWPECFHLH